jgi:hypothetical protein
MIERPVVCSARQVEALLRGETQICMPIVPHPELGKTWSRGRGTVRVDDCERTGTVGFRALGVDFRNR